MYHPRRSLLIGMILVIALAKAFPFFLANVLGVSFETLQDRYPWNFTPVGAVAIFGGAMFAQSRFAIFIPLLALFMGDLAILGTTAWKDGAHKAFETAFYPSQLLNYLALGSLVLLGWAIRNRPNFVSAMSAGFAGSLWFFIVSNFGVWAAGDGSVYPKTAAGLADCYVKAIPFFNNFLIATWAFSALLFSPYGMQQLIAAHDKPAHAPSRVE